MSARSIAAAVSLAGTVLAWSSSALPPLVNDPDINDDGVVNAVDLGRLRACYFATPTDPTSPCASSDLNGDGVVNVVDLGRLRAAFFQTMPTPADAQVQFGYDFARIDLGDDVEALAAGDLNEDGHLDLVAASPVTGRVSWALGRGDGEFAPYEHVAVVNASAVHVADVDGDGHVDAIAIDQESGLVYVLAGDGLGALSGSATPASFLADLRGTRVADLNQDGRADLALISAATDALAVAFGTPAGGFESGPMVAYTEDVIDLAVARFNTDTYPDLAILLRASQPTVALARVLLVGPGGTLSVPTDFETDGVFAGAGEPASQILSGDFDDDGNDDLFFRARYFEGIAPVATREELYYHPGAGDGTFGPPQLIADVHIFDVGHLTAVDADGDGDTDLVGDADMTVFLQDPAASYVQSHDFAGVGALHTLVADADDDGAPDALITTVTPTDGLRVARIPAVGTPGPPVQATFGVPYPYATSVPQEIAFLHVDGDGVLDAYQISIASIGVVPSYEHRLSVWRGDGTAQFASLGSGDFPVFGGAYALGDVNTDTIVDVAWNEATTSCARFLAVAGDGTVASGQTLVCTDDGPLFGFVGGLAIGDLNDDGVNDLAIASGSVEFGPGGLLVYFGHPGGGFDFFRTYALEFAHVVDGMIIVDTDVDGFADIVVAQPDGVTVFRGSADGPSGATAQVQTSAAGPLRVRDLNGDGRLDLALADDGSVEIHLQQPDGAYAGPYGYAWPSAETTGLAVADVNDDGIADLMSADAPGERAWLALGNGDGGFQPAVAFRSPGAPERPSLADVNGDGQLDLVVITGLTYRVLFGR